MSKDVTVADYMIREQAPARHRAVADVVRWFGFSHLPTGLPRGVAERCAELASEILDLIRVDDPELTRGLSALVQVKDHLVRAAIVAQRDQAAPVHQTTEQDVADDIASWGERDTAAEDGDRGDCEPTL